MVRDTRRAHRHDSHPVDPLCACRADRREADELLVLPKTHRMLNLLIAGETNNGKTALVKHFGASAHRRNSLHRTISRIPVIAVQAPPVPDERRFCLAIFAQANAPFRPSYNDQISSSRY